MLRANSWSIRDAFRSPRASAEDEAAFDEHLISRVALYGCTAAILLNVLQLLWWPMDAVLLAPDDEVRAAVDWFRASTFANHCVFLVLLSRPALRRRAIPIFIVGAVISCALLGSAVARMGRLDEPYFYLTLLAPMATVAVPLRLSSRLVANLLIGATLTLSYLGSRPAELASPFLGSALGGMLFAVLTATIYGILLFILTRSAFLSERAQARSAEVLKGYSEHLEDTVAEHTEQLRRLAAHLARASEAERARLSRELHDELGQQITAMRYTLSFVRARFHKDPDRAHEKLSDLDSILAALAAGVRDLVSELRPRVLDDRGLGAAVEWLVQRTKEHSAMPCELSLSLDASAQVGDDVAIAVFRIVQESLTNAVRHARAQHLHVRLKVDPTGVRVRVEDDGCGVGPVHVGSTGMGLLGMRERARALGGRLQIESRQGAGTAVSVHLPLLSGATP
jgi:signal transduction histidine kinase